MDVGPNEYHFRQILHLYDGVMFGPPNFLARRPH